MSGKHRVNLSISAEALNLSPNFQRKGTGVALHDHSFQMGVSEEDGAMVFQGGWWCSFYMKINYILKYVTRKKV